jgi:excinuclease UvrABC nuclease subunit
MTRPRWAACSYGRGLEAVVPEASGLYAVVEVSRLHGLPTSMVWLYVGQSKNLRRRYREHVHWTEPNPGLDAVRLSHSHEFWWTASPHQSLNAIEADLIDQLAPSANRRRGSRS